MVPGQPLGLWSPASPELQNQAREAQAHCTAKVFTVSQAPSPP